jgi:hypothetical protein
MTATADYEHALAIIRQLDRPTQARLVAQVVQDLAQAAPTSTPRVTDPRATLAEIREHFAKLGPVSPSVGEQLALDRQHRADLLEGKIRE